MKRELKFYKAPDGTLAMKGLTLSADAKEVLDEIALNGAAIPEDAKEISISEFQFLTDQAKLTATEKAQEAKAKAEAIVDSLKAKLKASAGLSDEELDLLLG